MIKLNEIPLDYEPRKKILPRLPNYVSPQGEREPEMSEFQSAFLCGAIKKFQPKKILEVGVAGGATTAIILQALEDIGNPYEMHSLDISVKFHRDKKLLTGFLAMFAKENNLFLSTKSTLCGEHTFHIGKFLPQVIDEIGGEIDFVVLDTIHFLPGEGMDFLAMLPYLKNDAVVVLHDVALHQSGLGSSAVCATGVLFSAVTAEKFINFIPEKDNLKFRYPNIAAFKINEQTAEHIENVFLSLILRWSYFPSQAELLLYREHYKRFYSNELCEIFQEAIDMNAYNSYLASKLQK